jgi:2-dehydro-3-deoxyglucarate aldolase/4-hydroxy-2-oxoheptanedioate aldolase
MNSSRLRDRLNEKGYAIGHMLFEFGTRGMPRILDNADLDFVVVDMEHSGFSLTEIANLMAWFKASSVSPLVRIPQIDYHLIAKVMDVGAMGIMAPNVKNGKEAQAVVDAVKYPPLGKRGVMLGGATTDYRSVNATEFLKKSNDETVIACQIESQEGLDCVEEIAATPGVDILWVGHFDLTNDLGIVGEFKNPIFLEALKKVTSIAMKYGKFAAIQPRNTTQAKEWMDYGFNVISISADIFMYSSVLTDSVKGVRDLFTS